MLIATSCGQSSTGQISDSVQPAQISTAPAPAAPAAPAATTGDSGAEFSDSAPSGDQATNASAPDTATTVASLPMEAESPRRPPILVAGPDGIHLVGESAEATLLEAPVVAAVDDRLGGLVYQVASGRYFNEPETTIVYWLPAGARDGSPLLVPTGNQWLRLIDVEVIDGATTVVYIRSEGEEAPEDVRDTLRTYDFVSGEVEEVAAVGGWESGVGQVSFGAGTYALNWFAEALSGFDFKDSSGTSLDFAASPYAGDDACFDGTMEDGRTCAENVAIDDGGTLIAYVELRRDAAGTVRGQDLVLVPIDGSGVERRVDLGWVEGVGHVSHIDLVTGHAIVNRRDVATLEYTRATVVDLSTGAITPLDRPGQARFTTSIPGP
jgi:hypothetical protein